MCKKCGNVDKEICELCGGETLYKTGWAVQVVTLDAEHQGELLLKLKEVIEDKDVELKKILNAELSVQALLELKELIKDQNQLIALHGRVLNNKVTNADLAYIDCL